MAAEFFNEIEKIIRKDIGSRNLGKNVVNDDFEKAVKELYISSKVMIVTGFCIKDAMIGETDGPIGAVTLAYALEQLGKETVLVTDQYSQNLVLSCLQVKKVCGSLEIVPYEDGEKFCKDLLIKHQPSHVVAIERPGKARNGKFYSMRGEDLSDILPDTDSLIEYSKSLGIPTIAIGDGGNELGMGKIASSVIQLVDKGSQICAVSAADYVIVSGVSNWGGHGVVAALSLISGKMLLHDEQTEVELLRAMLEAGAVDGCTKKKEMTIDGVSLELNLSILKSLRKTVERKKNKYIMAI